MPAQPEKTKVLVVDDIAETRENIKRMLSFEQAIEVIGFARTGREAIEQAAALKPDVIIMDINMPDMDGIQATTEVKRKFPFIQVVILSVQSDPSYMRRAMLSGARDFLTKPPMIDELTEAIKRAGAMAHEEKKKASTAYPSNQSDRACMYRSSSPLRKERSLESTVPKAVQAVRQLQSTSPLHCAKAAIEQR